MLAHEGDTSYFDEAGPELKKDNAEVRARLSRGLQPGVGGEEAVREFSGSEEGRPLLECAPALSAPLPLSVPVPRAQYESEEDHNSEDEQDFKHIGGVNIDQLLELTRDAVSSHASAPAAS